MSKQTAVQSLVAQLGLDATSDYKKEIQEALKMEREQIEDAYIAGDQGYYLLEEIKEYAKDYYQQTYGGNK